MSVFVDHEEYETRCETLQQQFQDYIADVEHAAIEKDVSNLFRHRSEKKKKFDMRKFKHVLSIDVEAGVAVVEGLITYADLVTATLHHNALPTVVPELKTITVGGALTGIGIESSSFRYGLVHETVTEFDVLLASGEIVTCRSDNEYRDLFFAFPNSYGTLGYALRIVLKIVPCEKYVELKHQHFNQPRPYFEKLEKICLENHRSGHYDFIEGVAFNRRDLVISTGSFIDSAPYTHNYKKMHVYYKSIANRQQDFLTAEDYIWRWDTDWFWCSKVFGVQNPLIRMLVSKRLLNSKTYRKIMHRANQNRIIKWCVERFTGSSESVIQDVAIPIENAYRFFNFFVENITLRPFWMCPTMSYGDENYTLFDVEPNKLYINFGFWGVMPSDKEPGYYNRLIEEKVVELGGLKSLYSSSYYTEQEFWNIFNREKYSALKAKYDPQGKFLDLYSKVVVK
jgi:FAD/FMN-containing dehydrogenase